MSVRVIHADSREALREMDDASIDACVCDPPYALVSIVKRFGGDNAAPAAGGVYARSAAGFMGKKWDTGETAFDPAFWVEVKRVLKPGAHLVAFGGTRTYHRLVCAIEDAGFEVRDQLAWLFGSGFPKSHNVKLDGWDGWGTALKPAHEPICLARKPLIGTVAANVQRHGTGALNIDASRIATDDGYTENAVTQGVNTAQTSFEPRRQQRTFAPSQIGRWPANVITDGSDEVLAHFPESDGQQGDLNPTGRERPTNHAFGDMAAPLAHAARLLAHVKGEDAPLFAGNAA